MRILHVIPSIGRERGGPTAVIQALARHQVAAGHRVTIATTDQGTRHGESRVPLPGGVAIEMSRVVGPDRIAYAPRFALRLRHLLSDCDIAHVHSVFTYPVHAMLREALAKEVPVVLRPCGHLHRYSLSRSSWQKQQYLQRCGAMIRQACSVWHFTSDDEAAESWPWDDSPRFVLPNGVEPAEFAIDRERARAEVDRAWPQLKGSRFVLFLGRLHPKKRLNLLIEAFLAGAPSDCCLVVAGPDEAGLWPRLSAGLSASASKRMVRVNTVQGSQKAELLAAAAVFALPSEHENFGIAVLESLAAGTPVLVSPHVDLAPAVVAAGLGRAVPLDVHQWREALADALSNSASRTVAEAARAWVAEHYAWSTIAAELERHYQEVASPSTR
jgi:glycosyltransferase involved in cell wall biosynthesis